MKRFLGMLLTVCIILGLLTSCGKSVLEQYSDAVAKLLKSDQKVKVELAVEGDGLEITGIPDMESLKLIWDGTASADGDMAEFSLSLNIPSLQTTIELTDIVISDHKMYLNYEKLFNAISGIIGVDDISGNIMGDTSYVMMDLEEFSAIDSMQLQEDSELINLIKNIYEIYYKTLEEHDAVTKDGSTFLLTLDGDAIREFLVAMIGNVKENKDVYYDAILEMYSEDFFESMNTSKEDLTEQLDEILTKIEDEVENSDLSESSFNSKVTSTSRELVLNLLAGDDFKLNYSYSSEKTEMDDITTPTDYILWSEFADTMNSLDDYSSGIYGGGGASVSDSQEYSFNMVTDESISQIHTVDLSGYAKLINYNLVSNITDAGYSVPIIDGEIYESAGTISSSSNSTGVYISYYTLDLYGDEFLDYCEEDLFYTYDYYMEYGMTVAYSDVYVSADGNTLVTAMSYDLGNNHIATEVYVLQYLNDREMLYGIVEMYSSDMKTSDNKILSEYSELLGFDLSSFLTLYEKANASLI